MSPTFLLGALYFYLTYAAVIAATVVKALIDDDMEFFDAADVAISVAVAIGIGLAWPYLAARVLYLSARDG